VSVCDCCGSTEDLWPILRGVRHACRGCYDDLWREYQAELDEPERPDEDDDNSEEDE
jgi:hypothetical protein